MTSVVKKVKTGTPGNVWQMLLVLALVPAICEELAFRGFILSGFRHIGRKWRAIVITAFFFGVVHGIIQQSLLACLLGVVLGFLAVQSGSILPCIVFHFVHNSLAVLNSRLTPAMFENISGMESVIVPGKNGGCTFTWSVVIFGALAGLLIMIWFGLLPYQKTPEERAPTGNRPRRNARWRGQRHLRRFGFALGMTSPWHGVAA